MSENPPTKKKIPWPIRFSFKEIVSDIPGIRSILGWLLFTAGLVTIGVTGQYRSFLILWGWVSLALFAVYAVTAIIGVSESKKYPRSLKPILVGLLFLDGLKISPVYSLFYASWFVAFAAGLHFCLNVIPLIRWESVAFNIGYGLLVVLIGSAFFVMRTHWRAVYGVTEMLLGVIIGAYKLTGTLTAETGFAVMTAGIYLFVRGLDNVQQGLAQCEKDPLRRFIEAWKQRIISETEAMNKDAESRTTVDEKV